MVGMRPSDSAEGRASEARAHTVHCEDVLWAMVDDLAAREGRYPDDIICEAMQAYASTRAAPSSEPRTHRPPPLPPRRAPPPLPGPPPLGIAAPLAPRGAPAPPPFPAPPVAPAAPKPALYESVDLGPPTPAVQMMAPQVAPRPPAFPPPLPVPSRAVLDRAAASEAAREAPQSLWVTIGGTRYAVGTERFIIGRGKQGCDLRIDDVNISRHHVAIERLGAAFFLVDLGSTNGIYAGEERVTRRRIVHGDRFVLSGHELTFTFS